MSEPPSPQPGWIFGFPSTGDPALDVATMRAQLLGIRLAQALAERLDAVVSRPITIAAEQGWVVVRDRQADADWQRLGVESVVGEPGQPWEQVGVAVWAVLNSVQDFVVQAAKHPWPARAGGQRRLARGAALPLPGVAVEHDRIRLWYGDADRPVLELPAIRRRDLLG
jgi:hypothetical protein